MCKPLFRDKVKINGYNFFKLKRVKSSPILPTLFLQEELSVLHGKIRVLMAAHRSDLPPVDNAAVDGKSPTPIHTPKDLMELEMGGS